LTAVAALCAPSSALAGNGWAAPTAAPAVAVAEPVAEPVAASAPDYGWFANWTW
jgi:hypothetical protein